MKISGLYTNSVQSNKLMENNLIENGEKELTFSDYLQEKLDKVNELQVKSEESTKAFIKGEDIQIHEVLLNTEEAQLSLQLAVEIRNKLVEAYQELNRLQL